MTKATTTATGAFVIEGSVTVTQSYPIKLTNGVLVEDMTVDMLRMAGYAIVPMKLPAGWENSPYLDQDVWDKILNGQLGTRDDG